MFFMYHAEHGARLFTSVNEFESAGNGWVDSPAKLKPADDGHLAVMAQPVEAELPALAAKRTRKKAAE